MSTANVVNKNSRSHPLQTKQILSPTEIKEGFRLAFIVKTQSCLNYDIDIDIKETVAARYNVSSGVYVYMQDGKIQDGISYRCRLKDVTASNRHMYSTFLQAKTMVNQHIDRSGGWVLARIDGVDIYNRLLVTLLDIFTKQDLKDILISTFGTILQRHQGKGK